MMSMDSYRWQGLGHSLQVLPQVNTSVDARYFTVDFPALCYQHSNSQNTSTYLPTSNDTPICLSVLRNMSHLALTISFTTSWPRTDAFLWQSDNNRLEHARTGGQRKDTWLKANRNRLVNKTCPHRWSQSSRSRAAMNMRPNRALNS